MVRDQILEILDSKGISYQVYYHKPFYSCSDNDLNLPGLDVKCLLLEETDGRSFYLTVLRCQDRLDFTKLRQLVGSKKVEFASAMNCERILSCRPGSLSVLGLLITGPMAIVFFDQSLVGQTLQIHLCDNTATVVLPFETICKLLCEKSVDFSVQDLKK